MLATLFGIVMLVRLLQPENVLLPMLVTLPESQVIDADLSKTLSGNVTLELEDKSTYTMKTYASASFASTAVPQKRGVVKGLAGASFLLPTSAADLAAMTGTRFGEAVYAITPIDGHIRLLGEPKNYTYANVTYADKVLTYANGNTITKIGGGTAASCALNAYTSGTKLSDYMYDARYYIGGWGGDNWQDNGLVFKMKATSRLVGNLRFGFSLFGAANSDLPKNWKVV